MVARSPTRLKASTTGSPLAAAGDFAFDRPRARMMLVEVALDHLQVAGVGAKEEVGNGSDPGDQPQQPVEPDIPCHPRQLPFRHSKVAALPNDVGAQGGGGDVAYHRHHVEEHVEADAPV